MFHCLESFGMPSSTPSSQLYIWELSFYPAVPTKTCYLETLLLRAPSVGRSLFIDVRDTSTSWYHQSDIMTSGSPVLCVCSLSLLCCRSRIYAFAIAARIRSSPGRTPVSLLLLLSLSLCSILLWINNYRPIGLRSELIYSTPKGEAPNILVPWPVLLLLSSIEAA